MHPVPVLCLAAALAGPLHAQVCTGGNGGGADATGNQCSTPNDVAAHTTGTPYAPPAQAARTGGARPDLAAMPRIARAVKLSSRPSAPNVGAGPACRIATAAAAPGVPVHTASTGIAPACSGGADGGMDVTGNQCGEAPAAARTSRVALEGRATDSAGHREATPADMAPSGAMSGMDGSNDVDVVGEAYPPTAQDVRDAQYRQALAVCNAVANTKKVACRRSARSAHDDGKLVRVLQGGSRPTDSGGRRGFDT